MPSIFPFGSSILLKEHPNDINLWYNHRQPKWLRTNTKLHRMQKYNDTLGIGKLSDNNNNNNNNNNSNNNRNKDDNNNNNDKKGSLPFSIFSHS